MPARPLQAERVAAIFERELGIRVPEYDVDLFATGVVDSLAFINLLLNLEAEFGISIALERISLEEFRSVSRIAAFVERALDDVPMAPVRLASGAG